MSHFSCEDEALLQSMLRQLLQSVKEKITGAPSVECAEEILLHLEETDENFHNYEFVKYLRQYICSTLGSVIEEETEKCTSAQNQGEGSGYDTLVQHVTKKTRESKEYREMMHSLKNVMMVVVESLINKFEEDQMRNKEMHRKTKKEQHSAYYTDNCSDSDSSFNQSYTFMNQEQLQLLVERLDPAQPKEVRQEAMQTLCSAPPSDVLNCESWSNLRKHLTMSLSDPDSTFSDKILRFYAKIFSSSPLNMTREVYTSLAKHLELYFLSGENCVPTISDGIDITNPEIIRLLKKVRLLNEYQREVPSFWIRHPEKYMEEIVESTLLLLSVKREQRHLVCPKLLDPVYFLALLDIKAVWFKKWMHANYSRTVVLRLLEKKYKSLINASVQQCVYYFESCESAVDATSRVNVLPQQYSSNNQKTFYSGKELQYIYFVHSLCLLGRLLIYKQGRNLFPIRLENRKDFISLTDLLVLFIRFIYCSPTCPTTTLTVHTGNYSPAILVTEVLQILCDRTECATECLYTNTVIDALLHPIHNLLNGKEMYINCPETSLIHIADILARIAAVEDGLSLLLYGGNMNTAKKDSLTAAHTIVQFTKKLLDENISVLSGTEMLPALKGAFIFVCRQMYGTCEGLQVLIPYCLHESIADAWKKASSLSERIPTPVPGTDSISSGNQESQNIMVWEETLLDDLLNFAATPKGLLLLQNTGALNECVTFMFSRFSKKLQVSGCERFGYGVMVTQMAATSPGAVALQRSGFIKTLITELWAILECGRDDLRVTHPSSTPVDPIDRSCQKSFLALVNLLSYPAIYELIGDQEIPNKPEYSLREVPTNVTDVIDRLIILNSDAKIHSLFNYEQSHIFGLRLLSVLCCDLDTLLLLESQYKLSQVLLNAQKENIIETSEGPGNFIIDGLSVERNHILVRINLTGGPAERILPQRVLNKGTDPYPWSMFSSYPLPRCYLSEAPRKADFRQDSDLNKLLAFFKNPDKQLVWIENCRKQFCKIMKAKPDVISGTILAELIEKFVLHLSENPSECYFSTEGYEADDANVKNESLSSVQQLGIKMTVRYGKYLNLLKDGAENDLCLVLMHCDKFLKQQQTSVKSSLRCLQEGYAGYDWFASSVFLIMSGEREKTLTFLQQFSSLLISAFLWLRRLHVSVHLPIDTAESGIHPIYFCSAHYIEMLLKAELPLVFSAFYMSGFTPSQICQQWLAQCFWNYLDWSEICHYIATCIFLGPDYQIYMCISVFKHLQQDILQHTQTQDLQVFLKEEALHRFRVSDYLEYMESLEATYRPVLLRDMRNIRMQST
ncbi:protein broad-minded isoform X2 [Mauremys mutica]|nr:protein broad-minded isoform X2 [Mauremys mutica]XP_044866041.1 protein broad-minded isoform X2 [Mauremys mutica]XP_044866042.1 protein broad-minded isoform X2 [Mauremys mutica]XP_044866043.1 protein broad-minded isoform X2 [Mauremys mutica]XP_044866044.1 protein broad-minded isoform X2 [Mauremys mutica]XP_044866045.1 protein broad-minded isoform X2 [Mauremys mutica]XP_044866046.1 protein broad-minded isoform X2 [Mauremys mutica]XP_044866047.1 protein broad-minded isoform X2 [Mauremys mut